MPGTAQNVRTRTDGRGPDMRLPRPFREYSRTTRASTCAPHVGGHTVDTQHLVALRCSPPIGWGSTDLYASAYAQTSMPSPSVIDRFGVSAARWWRPGRVAFARRW